MPAKVDWYYHRKGCVTCGRSQDYLADAKIQIAEQVDARKDRISPADALKLVRSAAHLWVAKGKKVVHVDLKKDAPTDADLKKLIIGPSGFLRAPTIRRGSKLIIGFLPEMFDEQVAK